MARFPNREGDVATLALEIISGLTENAEDFPSPPLTGEQMQALVGMSGNRRPSRSHRDRRGPWRQNENVPDGSTWTGRTLEGGMVAGYHVHVAHSEGGEWKDVTLCFDTMAVLTAQERGIDPIYRVVPFNTVGKGLASNTVTALL